MKKPEEKGQARIFSRRQLLKCSLAAGAGLVAIGALKLPAARAQLNCDMPSSPASLTLEPYVDLLPMPPLLKPTQSTEERIHYELSADEIEHQFHRDLAATPMWGFNNMFPGPTLQGYQNQVASMDVKNNLEKFHLCVDPRVHGADALFMSDMPTPYITVHNHGILTRPEHDGDPEMRFPPGVTYYYEYPNIQQPATYWYHDHSLGVTRLTVHSGLAGFYLLRGSSAMETLLPTGKYEVPLILQDRSFNEDGTMWYPAPPSDFSSYADEFMGDFITVNGKVWPYLEVKRARYRLRMLNGSNHTTYGLTLVNTSDDSNVNFHQIGTDGGFLPRTTNVSRILLASAERADVIVDFSSFEPGTEILLQNDFSMLGSVVPQVMKFIVDEDRGTFFSVPGRLQPLPDIADPVMTRYHSLTHQGDDSSVHLINNMHWHMAATETPKAGTTEIWYIFNLTDDMHPMHLHQTQFQIMDFQKFDTSAFLTDNGPTGPYDNPTITTIGDPYLPLINERGLKDTVRVQPGEFVRLKVPFGPFNGRSVWHCHMLEHEDNDMMRPLQLV
jgi:spore coat protein A, manganese oxidase